MNFAHRSTLERHPPDPSFHPLLRRSGKYRLVGDLTSICFLLLLWLLQAVRQCGKDAEQPTLLTIGWSNRRSEESFALQETLAAVVVVNISTLLKLFELG